MSQQVTQTRVNIACLSNQDLKPSSTKKTAALTATMQ